MSKQLEALKRLALLLACVIIATFFVKTRFLTAPSNEYRKLDMKSGVWKDFFHPNGQALTTETISDPIPWVCAMRSRNCSIRGYQDLYRVALRSHQLFGVGRIVPILIYDGPPDSFTDEMRMFGAHVLYHRLSFHAVPDTDCNEGAYLRVDAPSVIQSAMSSEGPLEHLFRLKPTHLLYTDCDVLFTRPVCLECLLKYAPTWQQVVSYAVEHAFNSTQPFNTGVMIIHVQSFVQSREGLLAFGASRKFKFPAYDQGLMNAYFNGTNLLGSEWNYKVYWGRSDNIRLIHFHGPKPPNRGLDCVSKEGASFNTCLDKHPSYKHLIQMALEADGGKLAQYAFGFWCFLLHVASAGESLHGSEDLPFIHPPL
jgi:hypothetical protein